MPRTPKTTPKLIKPRLVKRVQTGVRMERSLVKVLKGLAEYLDLSMGDLLESMALHSFEGKNAFGGETMVKIKQLKEVYGMDYGAELAHHMKDERDKKSDELPR